MKKNFYILGFLLFNVFGMNAQTSNWNTTGNWSNAVNWTAGIPNSTINATGTAATTLTVNINGACLNLSQFLNSVIINAGVTLTVNGDYTASTTANANVNNGTLILKGDVQPAVGTKVLTINGGVTTVSGLTFPSFTID